ncbi:WD40-repeat-containing domain protein [Ilyonectria sp. MPI-CAGE-AT-0026]|nr:WD40-repeat-containing domain protein [Ilyonectria sp. MPI-CAGE-AT-0026]
MEPVSEPQPSEILGQDVGDGSEWSLDVPFWPQSSTIPQASAEWTTTATATQHPLADNSTNLTTAGPSPEVADTTNSSQHEPDVEADQAIQNLNFFTPCAATATMFLYAQGSSIVCTYHNTLTISRTFSGHIGEVQFLAVNNKTRFDGGCLVVSYDSGKTVIVWDFISGVEIIRYISQEPLSCAAWMRDGSIVFGTTQGSIILFEPKTSKQTSITTPAQTAITHLAPLVDCRTFAIGCQNGTLLIALLQPQFTLLHDLAASKRSSPITGLAWHVTHPNEEGEKLAVQTGDGRLQVWSVPKWHHFGDPARVIRLLRLTKDPVAGPNWMGWSRNGRIIQYSNSQTLSWDVRTKHVTYDSIPTLEHVRGLAVYGPGATLFTLGPNNTVQQFDLSSPSVMVSNRRHPVNLPPPPPVSEETNN